MGDRRLPTATITRRMQPLASRSRTGGYARSQAWKRQWQLVLKVWPHLSVAIGFLMFACVVLAVQFSGALRGFVLGAGLATTALSIWMFVFLLSGSASLLSSAMAESSVATDLNRLKRRRWRLVHGFKLRVKSDIDHVAIGPAGVLVVETKWSAEEWPPSRESRSYLSARLQAAIVQTEKAVTHVKGTFGGVTKREGMTRGVLVLSSPKNDTPWPAYTVANTTVIRAGDLEEWLNTLEHEVLTDEEIDELARALAAKDADLVQREAALGTKVPPTLEQLYYRWVVMAPITGLLWFLVLGAAVSLGGLIGLGAMITVAVLLAWRLGKRRSLRPALIGLLVSNAVVTAVVAVSLVRWALSR